MKILFIHPSVELYGADKILLYILEILYDKNDITVLLPKEGILNQKIKDISETIKVIVNENLPIVHSKLKFSDFIILPFKILKFNKIFKKNEFDILYCNTLAVILLLYTKWSKKKVIHVHEIIKNKILNFGFSVLIKIRTRNVICVSNAVKSNLLFSKRYKIIHNGIPDIASKYIENTIANKIVFTLPGRFMPQKGQWFLIEALNKLTDKEKEQITVKLFGSPPPNRTYLGNDLKKLILDNKLENIIEIKDFVQNIKDIYEDSNVILVPSIMADPFPTTVLEALEFSRPVIATDNGGAVEILDKNFSILIKPNDVDQFVFAIRFYLENTNKIQEQSKNARKFYENQLSLKNFKNEFCSYMFREIL